MAPVEGVCSEQALEDAMAFDRGFEKAREYDSGVVKAAAAQLVRATVVGYDPAADTYQLLDCTVPTSAHECNHTLGWSAAGADDRWVAAADLELDKNFTTKDACEELIKPLVAPYSTSMVELLERAQTDPALRAALADPAQAGLVAQGFQVLLSSGEGGDCPVLVGLASVFDSHAWMYSLEAFVSALELLETGQPAGVEHLHWYDKHLQVPRWIVACIVAIS